jgi:hypothetical protein
LKRLCAGTFVALLVVVASLAVAPVTADAAPAQATACLPVVGNPYPPVGGSVQIRAQLRLLGGTFRPGALSTILFGGAAPGQRLCGRAFSTPITLPEGTADAAGNVTFSVATPSDFQLNAPHHIDLFTDEVQVGSFDFCVSASGQIAALGSCGATGSNLPKTGADHVGDTVRIALAAFGLGATALYLRRRRISRTA